MTKRSAQRLAVTGMVLQLATAVGVGMSIVGMLSTFGSLGTEDDVAASAAKITDGVYRSLVGVLATRPLGFIGLVLIAIGLGSGHLRQRWVFRWSCVCMIPWVLSIGIGTLVGATGLVLLFVNRNEFREKKAAEPGATDNPGYAQ